MLTIIVGESGSGKSSVKESLVCSGCKDIITYTTRQMRPGEVQDKDYHFIDNNEFMNMVNNNLFLEYESYSGGRLYGTSFQSALRAVEDKKNMYVAVVTPGGLRAINKEFNEYKNNIFSVYVTAPLGDRVKRYIDRLSDKFNHSDMAEISQRVERDYGMFLNIERETDFQIENSNKSDISSIVQTVRKAMEDYIIDAQEFKNRFINDYYKYYEANLNDEHNMENETELEDEQYVIY